MIKHYEQMILFSQVSVCLISANSQHDEVLLLDLSHQDALGH